jgi:hypothetical protein
MHVTQQDAEDAVEQLSLDSTVNTDVPLRVVKGAVSNDEWLAASFDFSGFHHADDDVFTIDDLLIAYKGKWTLDALDVVEKLLNPDSVDIDTLRQPDATLAPPASCPVSAITSETLPPLLVDLASKTMRLRLVVDEVISSTFVLPHLKAVEVRRPGIFWDGHRTIGMHQDIADLFGNEEIPWDIGNIGVLHLELAMGLQVVMRYAEDCELEGETRSFIDESMVEYANYFRPQTAEWWDNPVFRIGALAASERNPNCEDVSAQWLEPVTNGVILIQVL